jgi:ribA/ribD-fused uncharacterized protein
MQNIIDFYSNNGPGLFLSNFSNHPIVVDNVTYKTVEHYFQAAKFFQTDPQYALEIINADTPKRAKELGKSPNHPIDPNWDNIRNNVMSNAVYYKVLQNQPVRDYLLKTGDSLLRESSPTDYYWGIGQNGTGQNNLGKILMSIRDYFRNLNMANTNVSNNVSNVTNDSSTTSTNVTSSTNVRSSSRPTQGRQTSGVTFSIETPGETSAFATAPLAQNMLLMTTAQNTRKPVAIQGHILNMLWKYNDPNPSKIQNLLTAFPILTQNDKNDNELILTVATLLNKYGYDYTVTYLTDYKNRRDILWNTPNLSKVKTAYKRELVIKRYEPETVKGVGVCKMCKSEDVTVITKQLASGDEPMTTFIKCLKCGKQSIA